MTAAPGSASPSQRGAREFALDTVIVAVTQLILRLRGLVLLPLIVQLLGTGAYGVWAQVVAFASFLSALVSLNFHLPLVREIAADRSRGAVVYTTLVLATVTISGVVAAALALVPGPIATLLLDSRDAAGLVQLGLLLMLFNNLRMLNINLYRATGRLGVRSAFELVTALGEVGGIIVILRRGGSLGDVLVFMVAWNGVIAIAQSVHGFVITGWARPQWSVVAGALVYAVPLIPASFANFALDRMDRFVIGYHHGAEGVGIYAANYAIGGLVMMAQTPFQTTLLPKVAALWDTDRAEATRYIQVSLTIFLTLALPFVIGIPFIAGNALALLANAQVARAAGWTTFLISAGVTFWGVAIIQAQAFYGARRTKVWGAITLGGAAVNLGLNLVLVPWLGVAGAAAATLVAYGAICLASAILIRPLLSLSYAWPHVAACGIAAAGMAGFLIVANPTRGSTLIASAAGASVLYVVLLVAIRAAVPAARGGLDVSLRDLLRRVRARRGAR